METLDWIIVIVLALGAISGFLKGFLKQLASIIGLVAGLLVARAFICCSGRAAGGEGRNIRDFWADIGFSINRFSSTIRFVYFCFGFDKDCGYGQLRFYQPLVRSGIGNHQICLDD